VSRRAPRLVCATPGASAREAEAGVQADHARPRSPMHVAASTSVAGKMRDKEEGSCDPQHRRRAWTGRPWRRCCGGAWGLYVRPVQMNNSILGLIALQTRRCSGCSRTGRQRSGLPRLSSRGRSDYPVPGDCGRARARVRASAAAIAQPRSRLTSDAAPVIGEAHLACTYSPGAIPRG
jgi:hypothetical protein